MKGQAMIHIKKAKHKEKLLDIPTKLILTGENPIRENFDEEELTRLADSIRRHGLLQPLKVRAVSDLNGATVYELISGRRRLRACKLLCIPTVACIVSSYDDNAALEIALCENLVKSDLNMFEQAEAISELMRVSMFSAKQAAEHLSVSESYITRKLKLLCFQKHERQLALYAGLEENQALNLSKIQSSEKRLRVLNAIIEGNLGIAQQDGYINAFLEEKTKDEPENRQQVKAVLKDRRIFVNTIERAVATLRSGGINVEFEKSESCAGDMVITIKLASS